MDSAKKFGTAILISGLLMQAYVVYFNWATWSLAWALKAIAFYLWDVCPFFYFARAASARSAKSAALKVFGILLLILHGYFIYLGTETQRATAGFIFIFTPICEFLLIAVGVWLTDYLGRRPAGS